MVSRFPFLLRSPHSCPLPHPPRPGAPPHSPETHLLRWTSVLSWQSHNHKSICPLENWLPGTALKLPSSLGPFVVLTCFDGPEKEGRQEHGETSVSCFQNESKNRETSKTICNMTGQLWKKRSWRLSRRTSPLGKFPLDIQVVTTQLLFRA